MYPFCLWWSVAGILWLKDCLMNVINGCWTDVRWMGEWISIWDEWIYDWVEG